MKADTPVRQKIFATGMGVVSSLGNSVEALMENLYADRSAVKRMEGWEQYVGLRSLVAAPAMPYDAFKIERTSRRTMSPMSEMGLLATMQALAQADLHEIDQAQHGIKTLLCVGSTIGSPQSFYQFYKKVIEMGGPKGQLGTSFFKVMSHSVASNIAVGLGFKGAVIAPSAACCTSTQAIAMGWELMQTGLYDMVIAGGADELDYTSTAIFDIVGAASIAYNDSPSKTARPFDKDRDGLVVSEGAGVVVLETETCMRRRGVRPVAEVLAGAYFCDGNHMAHPDRESMSHLMTTCLERSHLGATDIDYINAHATGTVVGDAEEVHAIHRVFGEKARVSSLKGHMGHSLAACGAIETIASIEMLRSGKIIGTRNLETPSPDLNVVDLVKGTVAADLNCVMINNFAFGGISASVVVSKCS
jgi:3-oxoacyl-[acyl-carrier-protein] synthase II